MDLGDYSCIIENNTIYIPLKAFSEAIGYSVTWDNTEKCMRICDYPRDISIYLDGTIKINGIVSTTTDKPIVIDNTMYVSLDLLLRNFDMSAEFGSTNNIIKLDGPGLLIYENGFLFDSKLGSIIDYLGADKDIIIPSTIGGESVRAIGENAFANKGLTSVEIPEGVESIGKYAFEDNRLTSLEIPSSVTSIGKSAFKWNPIKNVVTIYGSDRFRDVYTFLPEGTNVVYRD